MAHIAETSYVDIERAHGEFRIPVYQSIPDIDFLDDPGDAVFFGQGIGEIGQSQRSIINHLAEGLGRRVIGYESRLSAQTVDPWEDAVEIGRTTHQRVVDSITNSEYSVVGHSMFGLAAGAILEDDEGRITDMTLVSPAAVTPEAIVSEDWRHEMRFMRVADRARNARFHEKDWKKHQLGLELGYGVLGLAAEFVRGVADPIRSTKGAIDIVKDIAPGMRNAHGAFGVLANVSVVAELEEAQSKGTNIEIIVGKQDPIFRTKRYKQAVRGTCLEDKLQIISRSKGQGHSNMSTLSGRRQLDYVIMAHQPDRA